MQLEYDRKISEKNDITMEGECDIKQRLFCVYIPCHCNSGVRFLILFFSKQ